MRGGANMSINFTWDEEASVWIAVNEDIGLVLESPSYDALIARVEETIPELLELNHIKLEEPIFVTTGLRQLVSV